MPIINQIVKGGGTGNTVMGLTVEQGFGSVVNGMFTGPSADKPDFTGVTKIAGYAFLGRYRGNQTITGGFDASPVQEIGKFAFYGFGKESTLNGAIDFSGATTVKHSAFEDSFDNSNITSISFGSLEELKFDGYGDDENSNIAFYGACQSCGYLTNIDFSKLRYIRSGSCFYYAFTNCAWSEVWFSSLDTIDTTSCSYPFSGAFGGGWKSPATRNIYFPALRYFLGTDTTHFTSFEPGAGTTVHFPSNMQAKIESMGWTSENFVKAYDLPAVVTLGCANSVDYVRNPKYDTSTALAWRVVDSNPLVDWTAYYTSGTTDPAVGDTIYSDAACTTAVTTIDSIA